MQPVPRLRCGAGGRAARGQGAPGVRRVRQGPRWDTEGVTRCSEALLGQGTAVGPEQVHVVV